jgi:hypothetical protein
MLISQPYESIVGHKAIPIIFYSEYPLLWLSKFQTEVALSTTKAKYIPLFQSLYIVLVHVCLLAELKDTFNIGSKQCLKTKSNLYLNRTHFQAKTSPSFLYI